MHKKTPSLLIAITLGFSLNLFAQSQQIYTLTMQDAILLALRNNPTVQSAKLDRVVQKYALVVEKNAFEPQYALNASFNHYSTTIDGTTSHSNTVNATPSASLTTHYGSKISLLSDNPKTRHESYNPTLILEIRQPLIRGFGKAVVDAALNNALDNEEINKLSFENTIISTVNTIIGHYLSLFQAKEALKIDHTSLENYERTIKNNKAMIKAGRIPRSDIVQTEAQLARQKAIIQNDMNNITQARLQLLNTIGLDSTADIRIPDQIDLEDIINQILGHKKIPSTALCKQKALQ